MARAIWSGSISFGLVTIPVRLVVAIRDRSIRFNMLAPDGTCRLRQKLYCPETGKEYNFKQASRGYEIAPDQYILIEEKELRRLKPEAGRTITIVQFSKLAEIDPIYFDRSYYLVPEESSRNAYGLLVNAMRASGEAAIARFVMRDREHLAAIRPRESALVLHTMHFDEEIVPVKELRDIGKPPPRAAREARMAEELVAALSGPFDPAEFDDTFRNKLRKALQAKAAGRKIVRASTTEPESAPSGSLMEALRRSLERSSSKGKPARARPRRRAPARSRVRSRAA